MSHKVIFDFPMPQSSSFLSPQVEKGKLPMEELKRRFPQIVSFHFVSSYSGEGIEDLRVQLVKSALVQKYMGEKVPEAWLSLEKHLD
ncbi:hypothetical protein ElyMa_005647900, partial [Elysia marginata]